MSTVHLKVHRQNQAALSTYKKFLRMIPKVLSLYAADTAMKAVMEPHARNFEPSNRDFVTGKLTPHDSSNAAWNWRITFSSEDGPLMDKDKGVVGYAYEKRSGGSPNYKGTRDESAMQGVIDARVSIDIAGKLYSGLFSSITTHPKKFTMYNSLDQLPNSKQYVENANLANATSQIRTYASTGYALGVGVLNMFTRSGLHGMPDPEGLKAYLDSQFRSK